LFPMINTKSASKARTWSRRKPEVKRSRYDFKRVKRVSEMKKVWENTERKSLFTSNENRRRRRSFQMIYIKRTSNVSTPMRRKPEVITPNIDSKRLENVSKMTKL